jgi:hypothetical protein
VSYACSHQATRACLLQLAMSTQAFFSYGDLATADSDSSLDDSASGFDDSDRDSDNDLNPGSVVKMSGPIEEGDVLPVTVGRGVWYIGEEDVNTTEKFETAVRIASSSGWELRPSNPKLEKRPPQNLDAGIPRKRKASEIGLSALE